MPDEIRDKRKVLVFTYFADTVDWIVEYLESEKVNVIHGSASTVDGASRRRRAGSKEKGALRLRAANHGGAG